MDKKRKIISMGVDYDKLVDDILDRLLLSLDDSELQKACSLKYVPMVSDYILGFYFTKYVLSHPMLSIASSLYLHGANASTEKRSSTVSTISQSDQDKDYNISLGDGDVESFWD